MRFVRILLVALLTVAVPVQSLAAAARLHCGGKTAPSPVAASAHAGHCHEHQGQQAQGHHRGSAFAAQAPVADGVAHFAGAIGIDAEGDGATSAAGHTCSACALCSLGVGLLRAIPTLVAVDPSFLVSPSPGMPTVAFLASGPERPPRTLLI